MGLELLETILSGRIPCDLTGGCRLFGLSMDVYTSRIITSPLKSILILQVMSIATLL